MNRRPDTITFLTLLFLSTLGCGSEAVHNGPVSSPAPEASDDNRIVLPPDSPKLQQMRLATVELRQVLEEVVAAPGKVELNPNRVSRVLMPVAGRIRAVLVGLGDAVKEGQPLIGVDSPDANAALAASSQAEAHLRQAASAQSKAEKDLARVKDLYGFRAAALKDVTSAENDLVQAQAGVQSSQADVDQARERLEVLGLKAGGESREVIVRAPISGKVLEVAVAPGEYRTDTAASLMTVADLSTVWITSSVPESSIRLIEVGEPVDVVLAAYPNESFHGRVTRIADTVDAETRTVKVQAELANPSGRFRPEMFGSIRHSHGPRPVPVIPLGAVIQTGQGAVVYREAGKGVFEKTTVTVGTPRDGWVPVLSGLRVGERVVAEGGVLLKGN